MQISSSLHSYENAPKTYVYDRRVSTTEQPEETVINRREDAITGAQTVLSSSLAEALWAREIGPLLRVGIGRIPAGHPHDRRLEVVEAMLLHKREQLCAET